MTGGNLLSMVDTRYRRVETHRWPILLGETTPVEFQPSTASSRWNRDGISTSRCPQQPRAEASCRRMLGIGRGVYDTFTLASINPSWLGEWPWEECHFGCPFKGVPSLAFALDTTTTTTCGTPRRAGQQRSRGVALESLCSRVRFKKKIGRPTSWKKEQTKDPTRRQTWDLRKNLRPTGIISFRMIINIIDDLVIADARSNTSIKRENLESTLGGHPLASATCDMWRAQIWIDESFQCYRVNFNLVDFPDFSYRFESRIINDLVDFLNCLEEKYRGTCRLIKDKRQWSKRVGVYLGEGKFVREERWMDIQCSR